MTDQMMSLPIPFNRASMVYKCFNITMSTLRQSQEIIEESITVTEEENYRKELRERHIEVVDIVTDLRAPLREYIEFRAELSLLARTLNLMENNNSDHQISTEDRNQHHILKLRFESLERISKMLCFRADACLNRISTIQKMIANEVPWHAWLERLSIE